MWSSSSSGSSDEDIVQAESEEDSGMIDLLLVAILDEDGERIPKKRRRIPLMTGIQWVEEKLCDPKEFYEMFRMRRSVFRMLHETLVNNYGLKSTPSMCSKESLAMFLWICGSPQSNSNAADRFGHSAFTISKKFGEVLECVFKLAGDIIKPRDRSFSTIHPRLRKARFWPHFKNAIGAIDGTHIRVVVPSALKIMHINRHGYTSENVMAICDFDMRFTFVAVGWPGSVHDTRVFLDALVPYDNYPHPPKDKYYLVDSGYPNRTGYLAPYKGTRYHVPDFIANEPVGIRETFNHGHSSLRNVIERSFGCLKMKWRILMAVPGFPVDKQKKIVSACMALHNYIRDSALRDEHFEMFEEEDYYIDEHGGDGPIPSSYDDGTMSTTRDEIAESLMAA